jgi:hypothetical protein
MHSHLNIKYEKICDYILKIVLIASETSVFIFVTTKIVAPGPNQLPIK